MITRPLIIGAAKQFGYVTLFAASFPLAALFALLNNLTGAPASLAWKFVRESGG